MSQSKKYQKIMGLAMGAVLLGTPLAQSSMPVFAEDTTGTQAATDTSYTADQLNQLIADAQKKVAGATEPTPYLKDGKGEIAGLTGLKAAISTAQATDPSDSAAIQKNYQDLSTAEDAFDKTYSADLASYQAVAKELDTYNSLENQPQPDLLTAFRASMDDNIAGVLDGNYTTKTSTAGVTNFQEAMASLQGDLNTANPIFQAGTNLQKALNAGQKVIDGGQYTTDQLKDLQQAMAGIPTAIGPDYGDQVQTSIDAINAALAALPKAPTTPSNPGTTTTTPSNPGTTTTTPTQPVTPTSPALSGLQKYVAQVAPNVPAKTTPQLTRALAAAQSALAKNGTGYSENDLNVLNYALNKAYGDYVQTLITPLNAVGQVYTKGQGVTLYNQPAGNPVLTANGKDRTLADQSAWKVFDEVTLPDGSTWYNVGKNQWVNANYVLLEKSQVVKITVQNGAKLWQLNQEVFGDTNRTLGYQTDWRSFGDMIVQDQKFYNLGANQWVNAKDVTIEHE